MGWTEPRHVLDERVIVSLDAVIIGAGIAGLSCARVLADAGKSVRVIEKSRGLGGRCATRRTDSGPVDHGLGFYHGTDADFHAALLAADPEGALDGWPTRIVGGGTPCKPRSFAPNGFRLAFRDGMTTFPKSLAADVPVDFESRAVRVRTESHAEVELESGEAIAARNLVLALPGPQAHQLIHGVDSSSEHLRSFGRVLDMIGTVSSLTVLAGYGPDSTPPDWDVFYPDDSGILQQLVNESSKRDLGEAVLVVHAFPAWSSTMLEEDPAVWSREVLGEVARVVGPWAAEPAWLQTQRWRYARTDGGPALKEPLYVTSAVRGGLGLAGEFFAPGGGVQAAWRSGRKLAELLLGDLP